MEKQHIIFEDLGIINYKAAWDYQEKLVKKNLEIKSEARRAAEDEQSAFSIQHSAFSKQHSASSNKQSVISKQQAAISNQQSGKKNSRLDLNNELTEDFSFTSSGKKELSTSHHLLFCEHPPVYTLGKSGHIENVLLSEHEMEEKEIEFFRTNRGGDITFHGLQQVVGYPILDLEKFTTDIGEYLHRLEEVIIVTIADYGIKGDRSKGETGVWIEPGNPGRERKICAMGIRCSRWITMHGFALNVNTDLSYFDNIIPCGIVNKQVTSIEKELGYKVNFEEVKEKLKRNFEVVFNASLS